MPSSDTQFKKGNRIGAASRNTYDPRDLPRVTELAARGVRVKDIARAIGVSEDTWRLLMVNDSALAAAYDTGRGEMHDKLVGVLFEKAMSGDTVCILFSLKVFFGYRDQNDPSANLEFRPQINITLPGALPLKEFMQLEGELTKALPPKLAKELQRG